MATPSSFEEILENLLGNSVFPSEKPGFYREEKLDLWVKVVSSSGGAQWKFQPSFGYPRQKKIKIPSETTPSPSKKRAVEARTLSIESLSTELLLSLELLIRKGYVPRKEVYDLNDWKKAHRAAVKKLHPDFAERANPVEFSEIHEAFKTLGPEFKSN